MKLILLLSIIFFVSCKDKKHASVAPIIYDTIYVEDFGVVGDGITDDGPAIQRMWDQLDTTKNFVVKFSPKVYKINSPIFTGRPLGRATIVMGNGARIIQGNPNKHVFYGGGNNSILQVRNFIFDARGNYVIGNTMNSVEKVVADLNSSLKHEYIFRDFGSDERTIWVGITLRKKERGIYNQRSELLIFCALTKDSTITECQILGEKAIAALLLQKVGVPLDWIVNGADIDKPDGGFLIKENEDDIYARFYTDKKMNY